MDQKRSFTAAENGASESGKKEALAELSARPTTNVGLGCWAELSWAELGCGLGWAGWAGTKNEAPEPTLQNREHGGPKRAKNAPKTERYGGREWQKRLWQSFAYAYTKVWAGLGWAHEGLGWAEAGQTQLGGRGCGLSWAGPAAGWHQKRSPRAYPPKQGNAAARRPQTSQK